ncbi:anaerobic C4-dicarboxylate transporter family protein [Salinimicrobium sediminilitoris]|uniref:anaerobic C4-dicarboxylate transporter family protein n=1 Tax=Salinimicrobium sediminilitoris TaxID=2876715 RepID=UPI001E473DBD|nr:anaerobic C4-dicarboxylate transporter [Salinimicrobium sediminilitoris]MCC8359429.1 anaerobic C4-dicarboxylate transporter [Salinimicrobium sediminilitoris]
MFWIEFAVLIVMILIGSQMKGIGLGVMGIFGLVIFVFGFHMKPSSPPLDVMLIIIAIVTTAATLQASGGLDYLVGLAEKVIRNNPSNVTFIAPFATYVLCLFAGTSHIVYSILPIISEVATKKRIRPERPLSASVIASHIALTGSPISACTAALVVILGYPGALFDVMMISIPAGLLGTLAACFVVRKKGLELNEDPVFLEKMKNSEFAASIESSPKGSEKKVKAGAKNSVLVFSVAILLIVLAGAFPDLLPNFGPGEGDLVVKGDGTISMVTVICLITLSASAAMMLLTKTSAVTVTQVSLFSSMASATISVFGVVWMASTFMQNNSEIIKESLGSVVNAYPWTFAIALFALGIIMFSQAATVRTLVPLGISLGLSPLVLIASFPTVNSFYVLPGYPTLLAAINFDRTGSTKIGKYVINHSFNLPGFASTIVAVSVGFLLGFLIL